MAHPENQPPEDDDGGTFKLKPSSQPASENEQPGGIDSTMKLRKSGGSYSAPPPPPPSPLGNPTGPANPPSPFNETSVMPQSGGSQTGFQPSAPTPGQQPPLGAPPTPPPGQPYGQQPYGQQPPGGQYPPQSGHQYGRPGGPTGEAPAGVKRIGLMAMIAGGTSLVNVVVNLAFAGAETAMFSVPSLLFALAVLGYGITLPRGMLSSKGLRMTGIILMMIQGGFGLLGLLGLLGVATLIGGAILAMSLVFGLIIVGADGWATFVYFKDHEAHAWIKGEPAVPQQAGYPPQQGQPGGYPPPPPGYQQGHQGHLGQQQPQQPPYGR